MTERRFQYEGSELDLFAGAINWRRYWTSRVRPFVGVRVLEVGAGLGSVTKSLRLPGVSWTALEPDPSLASRITDCDVVVGTIEDVNRGQAFDSILYIDVLEHIEDDRRELSLAFDRLLPGGSLIVLAPAHQWLFTSFDASIGHYRRYNRKSLRLIAPFDAIEVKAEYLDSAGTLASIGNRLFLNSNSPTRRQITTWDSRLVPISRAIDPLTLHALGKSLLMVWSKPQGVGNS